MVEQSTGLGLDKYFDLAIDSSGDIGSVSGVDELQKDMSVAIWSIVDGQINGQVLTENVLVRLESNIRTRISNDERITNVNDVSVRKTGSGAIASVGVSADSVFGTINYVSN